MLVHPASDRDNPSHPSRPARAQVAADGFGGLLTIDLAAVRRNYRLLADRAPTAEVAGVVKADAYGLGAVAVASALYAEGCRTFFVAHVEEGVRLRAVLRTDATIVVLHGPPPGSEPDCDAEALIPVLNCGEQLAAWLRFSTRNGLPGTCAVQFDTGMTRFGFDLSEAGFVAEAFARANIAPCLLMSHLACADDAGNPANRLQRDRLGTLRALFPSSRFSLAASSGIFLGSGYHFDLVRPGAALYGVNPLAGTPNPMSPVVRLQGRIMQIRAVPAATAVGYGLAATTRSATHLATVAVGYADGFPRGVLNKAAAWLGETPLPLVGRVSMDSVVVDLGAVSEALPRPGDLLDILCGHYGIDDLAADAGTIGYEILTRLGARYWRTYVA